MKYLLLLSFCLVFTQVKAQQSGPSNNPDNIEKTVLATYYHRKFEGRRTSSGVKYRAKQLTAAHRTLPMGTLITVTNPDNGKSVIVKVNDRGPFSKKLAIDLSESAAKQIGIYRKGVASVNLNYTLE